MYVVKMEEVSPEAKTRNPLSSEQYLTVQDPSLSRVTPPGHPSSSVRLMDLTVVNLMYCLS